MKHIEVSPRGTIVPAAFTVAMLVVAMSGSWGSAPMRPSGASRFAATPMPCTKTASPSFVAIPAEGNVSGGSASAILAGTFNTACDAEEAIGGGYDNREGYSGEATQSFIAGGEQNQMLASDAFVGAGVSNVASGNSEVFIGTGYFTTIVASQSADGAGIFNTINGRAAFAGTGNYEAYVHRQNKMLEQGSIVSGTDAFVGSGDYGVAVGNGSFIGAGGALTASASSTPAPPSNPGSTAYGTDAFAGAGDRLTADGNQSFAGAGTQNAIATAAPDGTIPGGASNTVGGSDALVTGGYGNAATGTYAMIPGGYDNKAAGTLTFAGGYHADAKNNGSFVWADYVSGAPTLSDTAANQFVIRATGGTKFFSNEAATAGVSLAPGSGTWASLSDRNVKTDITPVDAAMILERVERLPVSTWQYRSESGVRHAGPMAQDFYAAFHTGADDRHITTIDEDGVALAAAKGLIVRRYALVHENDTTASATAHLSHTMDALASSSAGFTRETSALASDALAVRRQRARIEALDAALAAKEKAIRAELRR